MNEGGIRLYGYRWIVLAAFMLIAGMTQVLWITFAPITIEAAASILLACALRESPIRDREEPQG